jgi:predicted metal-dependent phosphoesterase TrpH
LPSPAAAAALIRQAGGLAILAHPSRLADEALAAVLIEDLDGIECDYAAYDPGVRATLREFALRRGKLVSCGSDYHGYFDGSYVNHRFEGSTALLTRLGITRER